MQDVWGIFIRKYDTKHKYSSSFWIWLSSVICSEQKSYNNNSLFNFFWKKNDAIFMI